jgi:hypothetical protein
MPYRRLTGHRSNRDGFLARRDFPYTLNSPCECVGCVPVARLRPRARSLIVMPVRGLNCGESRPQRPRERLHDGCG